MIQNCMKKKVGLPLHFLSLALELHSGFRGYMGLVFGLSKVVCLNSLHPYKIMVLALHLYKKIVLRLDLSQNMRSILHKLNFNYWIFCDHRESRDPLALY